MLKCDPSFSLLSSLEQSRRPWLVSLLCSAISLSGGFGAEAPSGGSLDDYLRQLGYEPLEFRKSELNRPLVEGQLGNGKKLAFLVDTGWGITTLGPAGASGQKTLGQLGVTLEDPVLGKLTDGSVAVMDKLVLGRAQFLNQPARVEQIEMGSIHVPFKGILGCDFFFRNSCLVDCGARRIYFHAAKPSGQQAAALEETLRRSGFAEVPMHPSRGLIIMAEANGQPVKLIVDTGSTFSVLDDSQLKRLGLTTERAEQPELGSHITEDVSGFVVGVGKIGRHQLRVTTLPTLKVGVREWKNVHVGVANLKAWGIAKAGTPAEDAQGTLGNELLVQHGALIDFTSKKLWFRPERSAKP